MFQRGNCEKIPVEKRKISRAVRQVKFSLKTGIFRKYSPPPPPPNMIYLFNYTEYYLEHWLNK